METVVASERYETARCIASQVQKIQPHTKQTITERIHELTTKSVSGYLIMAGVLLLVFWSIFAFGGFVSSYFGSLLYGLEPIFTAVFGEGLVKESALGRSHGRRHKLLSPLLFRTLYRFILHFTSLRTQVTSVESLTSWMR